MPLRPYLIYCLLILLITTSPSFAWGPDGHHTVGAIADSMIVGTHAAKEVKNILGNLSLQDASVWADCAKGIDPSKDYTYQSEGKYPECKIYETTALEAEMSDFVRRNDTNCNRKLGEESCHKQYHYTDIAIQHDHYDSSFVGARNDDIVRAVAAAARVLKGDASPAPFNIKSKREALLLLSHYVGDIHQPLHVGAIYLDKKGNRVNPDGGTYDPHTSTRGGNSIAITSRLNLHSIWDAIPASLKVSHLKALLKQSGEISLTDGQIENWPIAWGNNTITEASQAFDGLTFGAFQKGRWKVTLPARYSKRMNSIKNEEIVKAGAHLAQLLQAIWP